MPKEMKLQGQIRLEDNGDLTFLGTMFEGTPFHLKVDQLDIERSSEFNDKKLADGWLFVMKENQYRERVAITLPKATLQFGKQIVVTEFQLMPKNLTIADFLPQNHKF